MGLLSRATDTFYAFRFLRLLTTPWEKTGAYRAGLIDEKGKLIKKPETSDEKTVYNYFHRLVFNVKRMLNKLPLGKTTIASYITALFLIKEHSGLTNDALAKALSEIADVDACMQPLLESTWYQTDHGYLREGAYMLRHTLPLPKTGEMLALRNTRVIVESDAKPIGNIFNAPVYKVHHQKTNQNIYVTLADLIQ
jgi:hypothetical protein